MLEHYILEHHTQDILVVKGRQVDATTEHIGES